MPSIHPIVLSGGSGTRLWPLSREHYPKQLLNLVGERTLLQQAFLRIDGMADARAPLVVCNEEHRFLVAEQLRELDKTPMQIILEPVGKNTAPAATLAALCLKQDDTDALMLIMPADHVIRDVAAFQAAVMQGAALAQDGKVVTFGIVPTSPETGYGYIRRGDGHRVEEFVEKPDRATAQRYIDSGRYLWNSGIFLVSVGTWLKELERHRPQIFQACRRAYSAGKSDSDFFRVESQAFSECPGDSIDYAVMEKTDRAAVIPLDAGWSDIGAWSALWQVSEHDRNGNALRGDVCLHDTSNSLLFSNHRLVAAVGVSDLIVVETADAVLVMHKDRAQNVREVVEQLKQCKRTEHLTHRRVHRPWGSYESVDGGQRFQVKRLVVKPGAALSLQMHHHRAEHWVVVKGVARVTRGEETFMVHENESTFIPVGVKHRLENPGITALEIVEVQSGGYLGEDDIVRFEDKYNRQTS
jgi:mannose-1-phosphate guanylyltransferase/mannose-6-phosphate isomerase